MTCCGDSRRRTTTSLRSATTSSRSSPGRGRIPTSWCGSAGITGSSDRSSWTRTAAAHARSSRRRGACSRRIRSCSRNSSAPTRNRPTRSAPWRSATKRKKPPGCSRTSGATALRIVRDPDDQVAIEAFARCVLSPHFLQEVLASPPFPLSSSPPVPLSANAERGDGGDFLAAVRTLARRRPQQDPDTKKLWRLVYQVENLRALPRSHRALAPLVDEILSQSVGPYRNALEERHDELTDPAEIPEAVRLAARLDAAIVAERDIVIESQGGLEIALRGMLAAAGVLHVPSAA